MLDTLVFLLYFKMYRYIAKDQWLGESQESFYPSRANLSIHEYTNHYIRDISYPSTLVHNLAIGYCLVSVISIEFCKCQVFIAVI